MPDRSNHVDFEPHRDDASRIWQDSDAKVMLAWFIAIAVLIVVLVVVV